MDSEEKENKILGENRTLGENRPRGENRNLGENKTLGENQIHFVVNGKNYKLDDRLPPTTSLLRFLREVVSLKGTKGLCYEGGCGICSVVVSFIDRETGLERTCSVNACQVPVYSCDGWVIETIEHLGDRYKGYHKLQKALVGFYGTQCGYCSPGFVMTMYGELKSSGKLTSERVEKALDGNICRCTGYRPILDAFKSLAEDAPTRLSDRMHDIEDSYKSSCLGKGELCQSKCLEDGHNDDPNCQEKKSCKQLVKLPMSDLHIDVDGIKWYRPLTLQGVYNTLQNALDDKVRIIVGNTGEGVYKSDGPFKIYIDTNAVDDLFAISLDTPVTIGANVNLHRCIEVFKHMADNYPGYQHLREIAKHWSLVANQNIRNVGSWAGNLMLKHAHKEFPSDIFVTMATIDVVIKIGHSETASTSDVTVERLMEIDMSKNIIVSMTIPPQNEKTIIRTYKISPRSVNAHAYVNGGFKLDADPKDGFKILAKPSVIYGGIHPSYVHAEEAENFLIGRSLSDERVVKQAARLIGKEMVPDSYPVNASPRYRISLSQALFYKCVLNILGDTVSPIFRSGGSLIERPLASGKQSFDPNQDSWPVGEAIPKIESNIQVAGEAAYLDDADGMSGELHGAFVQSTLANAELDIVDPLEALRIPGVVAYIDAQDIPGINSFFPHATQDPIFTSSKVDFSGQSIGLIVAENQAIAIKAAKMVRVTYKNLKKPVLTIKEALKEEKQEVMTFPEEQTDGQDQKKVQYILEGEFEQGSQFHLSMETLGARVVPVEDGYDVFATTQWPSNTQNCVAKALNISNNSINLSVRRLGGGFGGKISRGDLVACAAAVASHKLRKPVRITLDLTAHMTLVGWRDPYMTKYKVMFDREGLLKRVDVRLVSDAGCNSNEGTANFAYRSVPNVYQSEKWGFDSKVVNTTTAPNTYCRTPGTPEAVASMENIIERIADFLGKDPAEIREKNFLDDNSKSPQGLGPRGENLVRTKIFPMLKKDAQYESRRADVNNFNKNNRWKKRGLSMVPLYYSLSYFPSSRYNTQVVIYSEDGTVVLAHGGIEMGQGLNTKVSQVAAKILGVPLSSIKVKATNVVTGANSTVTGGSLGSDLVAHGIQVCCENLRLRMDPVAKAIEKRTKKYPTWKELVSACLSADVDLSERYWTTPKGNPEPYDIFAAACMEVEVDVLTGQFMMRRADIIEDCGRSMSPYVDIGQIEGAFVMGLGFYTSELVKFDPETGQKLTTTTWDYHPPTATDIPVDFRVTLLPKGDNKFGVMRSKATGEPALCLSYSVITALRDAIKSARQDAGTNTWFEMNTPLTVEVVQQLCKVSPNDFDLQNQKIETKSADEDFIMLNKEDLYD